jgi:hypothetical protein
MNLSPEQVADAVAERIDSVRPRQKPPAVAAHTSSHLTASVRSGFEAPKCEGGLLSASEVAQLKLNADWVVLSLASRQPATSGRRTLSGHARANDMVRPNLIFPTGNQEIKINRRGTATPTQNGFQVGCGVNLT